MLLLAFPIVLALLMKQFKWQKSVAVSDKIGMWLETSIAKTRDKSGYFTNFVQRPILWCANKLFAITASIGDEFLKAGVRFAACLYLIGAVLFLAYVITVVVLTIIAVYLMFALLFAILDNTGQSSGSRSSAYDSEPVRYPVSEGESRQREGIFGSYTETRDADARSWRNHGSAKASSAPTRSIKNLGEVAASISVTTLAPLVLRNGCTSSASNAVRRN